MAATISGLKLLHRGPPQISDASGGQVQKGDASGDCRLRLTAIMLCRGYAVHEAADEGWLRASIRLQGAGVKRPSQRFGLREKRLPTIAESFNGGHCEKVRPSLYFFFAARALAGYGVRASRKRLRD